MTEITITMRQIADAKPCSDNWKDAPLKALGKTEIDDTPVTFRQIIETSGWGAAMFCLRCLPESELWRVGLLARRFALHVVHLWDAPQIAKDWLVTGGKNLRAAAGAAARAAARAEEDAAEDAARTAWDAAWATAEAAAWAEWDAARATERAWQTQELLRIMSLDYSPEALILKMPEGTK